MCVFFFYFLTLFLLQSSSDRTFHLLAQTPMFFNELIVACVHFGHMFYNKVSFSSWLFFLIKANVTILNLSFFIIYFITFKIFINSAAYVGAPFWFINLDQSFDRYVQYFSRCCGETSITFGWVAGLLANSKFVLGAFFYLVYMSKSVWALKNFYIESVLKDFIKSRDSWPRASFFSSVFFSRFASSEAVVGGVPNLGIVDSNAPSFISSWPLPGNDDSLESMVFYNDLLARYILYRKLFKLIRWYYNIRRSKRVNKFVKWVPSYLKKKFKRNNFKNNIESKFKTVISYGMSKGLNLVARASRLFFLYNRFFKMRISTLDIFEPNYFTSYTAHLTVFSTYIKSFRLFLLKKHSFYQGHAGRRISNRSWFKPTSRGGFLNNFLDFFAKKFIYFSHFDRSLRYPLFAKHKGFRNMVVYSGRRYFYNRFRRKSSNVLLFWRRSLLSLLFVLNRKVSSYHKRPFKEIKRFVNLYSFNKVFPGQRFVFPGLFVEKWGYYLEAPAMTLNPFDYEGTIDSFLVRDFKTVVRWPRTGMKMFLKSLRKFGNRPVKNSIFYWSKRQKKIKIRLTDLTKVGANFYNFKLHLRLLKFFNFKINLKPVADRFALKFLQRIKYATRLNNALELFIPSIIWMLFWYSGDFYFVNNFVVFFLFFFERFFYFYFYPKRVKIFMSRRRFFAKVAKKKGRWTKKMRWKERRSTLTFVDIDFVAWRAWFRFIRRRIKPFIKRDFFTVKNSGFYPLIRITRFFRYKFFSRAHMLINDFNKVINNFNIVYSWVKNDSLDYFSFFFKFIYFLYKFWFLNKLNFFSFQLGYYFFFLQKCFYFSWKFFAFLKKNNFKTLHYFETEFFYISNFTRKMNKYLFNFFENRSIFSYFSDFVYVDFKNRFLYTFFLNIFSKAFFKYFVFDKFIGQSFVCFFPILSFSQFLTFRFSDFWSPTWRLDLPCKWSYYFWGILKNKLLWFLYYPCS